MATKEIIIFITTVLCFFLISGDKMNAENKEPDILILKTRNNDRYSLLVHGKPVIKVCLRNRHGKKIDQKEWTNTKINFNPEGDYSEIAFKMAAGWIFSGLRIQQSDDEVSFQNGNILITLRDLQEFATLYRSDKRTFYILTNKNCYFRIRIFEEGNPSFEKTFILKYIPSNASLDLLENAKDYEPIGGVLDDRGLRRTPD